MEKLKEDYINIDTRLEYMKAIAVKFVPDVDIDPSTGEQYICDTTALPIFIRRYNLNKLYGNFTYEDYITNEDIQNTLKGLGINIDKFWFLLLFIFDYTCGTCLDGMKATGIGIEQLTKFAKAIADNHKEINQFGVSFKKPITVSVKIEGCFIVNLPVWNTSPKINFCRMSIISGSVPCPVSASSPNSV